MEFYVSDDLAGHIDTLIKMFKSSPLGQGLSFTAIAKQEDSLVHDMY